jgi:SWI/SNF-related matrix-associated actin-dependent regulator of chromatin subfamily A-like protein 1
VIPQYLERPRAEERTFGVLSYERGGKAGNLWVIDGEPQVIELAKRLFPGSAGRGSGRAKFPATRRTFGDLVWLMQRWPLKVSGSDRDRWEAEYQATCEYVLARDEFNRQPNQVMPGPLFTGELRPYQAEGVAWVQHNRRTLIADDTGLGKTVEALACLAAAEQWPALIVMQPHLVLQWHAVIRHFLRSPDCDMPLFNVGGVTVEVLRGRTPHALGGAHIYLIHYLLLASWRKALVSAGPKVVIFDEIQELRRRESAKYSAAHHIAQQADTVIGLSATPIYGRGGEIWNVMNVIEMHCLGDWDSFTREWCTGYGSDTVKDPKLLGEHLRREGLMLRRTKKEVAAHMPPKSRIVQVLDHDEALFSGLIKEAVRLAKSAANEEDVLKRGRIEREALDATRQATGLAKVGQAAAFIAGMIEAGEPPLVFAHHHAVVDGLVASLREYKPVVISGRQSAAEKEQAKQAFISGDAGLCIISLRSSAGIDGLHKRARIVIFVELDWSPAVHTQGEDRAHRDDQPEPVIAYYLVIEDGTDPEMQAVLGLKAGQAMGIMGDEVEDPVLLESRAREHMKHVLEKLRAAA